MTSAPTRRTQYTEALRALKGAQKPARGTAAYSRLVNRPVGRLVAAAGHVVGLTPNQATAVSATLSAAGIISLAVFEPSLGLGIAVALLLALGYVLDSVDGQLSRLRGFGSRSGEWLDHTVDCFKTSSLHLAVLISWYRFPVSESAWVLLVPILFEVVSTVTFFGLILVPTLRPVRNAGSTLTHVDQPENPARQWLLLPVEYGTLCLSFILLAWPTAFLVGYTFFFAAAAGALALALRKWWQELRALDQRQETTRRMGTDEPLAS